MYAGILWSTMERLGMSRTDDTNTKQAALVALKLYREVVIDERKLVIAELEALQAKSSQMKKRIEALKGAEDKLAGIILLVDDEDPKPPAPEEDGEDYSRRTMADLLGMGG